jgi:hypothetical protein
MVARESGWLDELRSRSGLPSNKQATARQLPETKVGGGAPGALPLSSWIVAAAEANTKQNAKHRQVPKHGVSRALASVRLLQHAYRVTNTKTPVTYNRD